MNYPMRQQTPNGWQVAGQALQGAGEAVGQFSDKQAQMRALFQQMVEKRQAAILAQKQQEQEMELKRAEDARQEAEAGRKSAAEENRKKFQEGIQGKVISATLAKDPSLAKSSKPVVPGGPTQAELDDLGNVQGMQMPNQDIGAQDSTAMMGNALDRQPVDMGDGRSPLTDDEYLLEALRTGQVTPKDYYELKNKPAKATDWTTIKTSEGYVQVHPQTGEIRKLGVKPPADEGGDKWTTTEVNGRKIQVNDRSGDKRDLGPITPKHSAKASENIKAKLQTIAVAKQQLAKVRASFDKIRGTGAAGPKWTGQGVLPSQDGELFDADVDALRQTARSLTRTPGEGSMSDSETKLSQAAIPTRGRYEEVTQRQIENWEDLISLLENGYSRMQSEIETPDAAPAAGGIKPKADPLGLF